MKLARVSEERKQLPCSYCYGTVFYSLCRLHAGSDIGPWSPAMLICLAGIEIDQA